LGNFSVSEFLLSAACDILSFPCDLLQKFDFHKRSPSAIRLPGPISLPFVQVLLKNIFGAFSNIKLEKFFLLLSYLMKIKNETFRELILVNLDHKTNG
jgi:hypothetical protein